MHYLLLCLSTLLPFLAVLLLVARFTQWLGARPLGTRADAYLAGFSVALYAAGLALGKAMPSAALGWWTFGNDALALGLGFTIIRTALRLQAQYAEEARAAAVTAQAYAPGGVAVNFDPPPPQLDVESLLRIDPDVILGLYVRRASRDVSALQAAPVPGDELRCHLERLSACAEALAVFVPGHNEEGAGARFTAVQAAAWSRDVERARELAARYAREPGVDATTRERIAAVLAEAEERHDPDA